MRAVPQWIWKIGSGENGGDRYRIATQPRWYGKLKVQFVNTSVTLLWSLWRTFTPDESQVGHGIAELLSRHRGVGKHACAGMAFAYGVESGFIGGQSERLPIPEVGWWWIELIDERGGIGRELWSLVLVPINAMAIVAHALPVENRPAPLGIVLGLRALVRRLRTGPGIHVRHLCKQNRQPTHEKKTGMTEDGPTVAMRAEHRRIGQQLEVIHGKVAEQNPDSDQEEQSLLDLLGSHNRKEERALYPAIDQVASAEERETVFRNMKNIPEERYKLCCGQH